MVKSYLGFGMTHIREQDSWERKSMNSCSLCKIAEHHEFERADVGVVLAQGEEGDLR